jgi:hypothetical protein
LQFWLHAGAFVPLGHISSMFSLSKACSFEFSAQDLNAFLSKSYFIGFSIQVFLIGISMQGLFLSKTYFIGFFITD